MISAAFTPNLGGIVVQGDLLDFEELYDSIHAIVAFEDDGTPDPHETLRLMALAVCFDIRHAIMGEREFVFVDNGMDNEKKKCMGVLTPDKNIYYSFKFYIITMVFAVMALEYFILRYARQYNASSDWDKTIAAVRKLQAVVMDCLKQQLTMTNYKKVVRNIGNFTYNYRGKYVQQYLDEQTIKYLNMNREKRLKSLPGTIVRLAEMGEGYKEVKQVIQEAAATYGCPEDEICLEKDYPEEIDW